MGQPLIFSAIDRAVFEYKIIEEGDRILIGASGGKDSTALIEYFAMRSRRKNCNFQYKAVAVQSDFAPPFPENIRKLFEEWDVPFEVIDVDIIGRLKEGRKMNCYWCSTQRRTELLRYAIANGYNKIALGHHLDDILETLLMNMIEHQKLTAMPPVLQYDKYPVKIIRPLCYCAESSIIEHGREVGYLGWTCTCSYQDNSTRKTARKQLEFLTGGDVRKKQHMFEALKNIDRTYLP